MKIIGVIGLNGSGKDEVVNYLNKRYGVSLFSIGDIVREIAFREGIEPTRDNLDGITRKYFTQFGEGYFLKQVVDKIRRNMNSLKAVGISGIRSPQDIDNVRNAFGQNFILIYVYITDSHIRYQRIRHRGSKRDDLTCDDFLKQDQVSEELFHIQEAIKMAEFSISNDGSLEDLHRQVEKLVEEKGLLN
jgi:dephospho-CoA kinase